MQNCIFCKIVKGELPAFVVFEDDCVLAFLDINPLAQGHTLVIPKKHYENIFDIDEETLQRIIVAAQKIAQKMKKVLSAEGVNVINASGKTAEQSVPHFHLHLIPRKRGDKIDMNAWWQTKTKKITEERLKELTLKLKI